jgi:hypothetical protein
MVLVSVAERNVIRVNRSVVIPVFICSLTRTTAAHAGMFAPVRPRTVRVGHVLAKLPNAQREARGVVGLVSTFGLTAATAVGAELCAQRKPPVHLESAKVFASVAGEWQGQPAAMESELIRILNRTIAALGRGHRCIVPRSHCRVRLNPPKPRLPRLRNFLRGLLKLFVHGNLKAIGETIVHVRDADDAHQFAEHGFGHAL